MRPPLKSLLLTSFILTVVMIVPSAFALEQNGIIEMAFTDEAPVIDGRWTTPNEWKDATVTEMSGGGNQVFLLIKHDRDFIYALFDAVSDQNKYGSGVGGAHTAVLAFDMNNDGGPLDKSAVFINYGVLFDGSGTDVSRQVEFNNFRVGDPNTNKLTSIFEPSSFDYAYSTNPTNSAFEPGREHYIHEFRVPISFLQKQDRYGFAASYRMGGYSVETSQQERVFWPPTMFGYESITSPSEWGTLLSPENKITAPPVPAMSVSEKNLSFGNTGVSEKSSSKSVTINNRGTGALKVNNIRASSEFSISGITTPTTIPAGQSVTFQVVFAPLSIGEKTGTVTISSSDLSTPTYTISLEGKGVEKGSLPGGGCLIATAAYGTELAPQVQALREMRDGTIFATSSGTAFMSAFNDVYYSFSPTVADWERQNPAFKEIVKVTITPMLSTLAILNYVDIDSEQEMLGYGIGIILLNVGMYFVIPTMIIIKTKDHIRLRYFSE